MKKSGAPYGPMDPVSSLDREKWLEENADRLSRMDRLSTSSQNQLASAGGGAGQQGMSVQNIPKEIFGFSNK